MFVLTFVTAIDRPQYRSLLPIFLTWEVLEIADIVQLHH
jgi:hypothetical protein